MIAIQTKISYSVPLKDSQWDRLIAIEDAADFEFEEMVGRIETHCLRAKAEVETIENRNWKYES